VRDTSTTCPRHVHQALAVCSHLEKWIEQDPRRASQPLVARALTAAIAACDKSAQTAHAIGLLDRFRALGVPPSTGPFSAAICACRHSGEGGAATASGLLATMRRLRVARSAWTFNALVEARDRCLWRRVQTPPPPRP